MHRKRNSGSLWIRDTSGDGWIYFNQTGPTPGFHGGDVGRLPVDMVLVICHSI